MKLSLDEALKHYAIYEATFESLEGTYYRNIRGVELTPGYLHRQLDNCLFEDDPVEIKASWKKVEMTHEKKVFVRSNYCYQEIPFPQLDGLELEDWMKEAQPFFLKKEDVDSWEIGDAVQLICFDRNFRDIVISANTPNTLYTPDQFFKPSWVEFTKTGPTTGILQYPTGTRQEDFEFHIEYRSGYWYPLIKEVLPSADFQGLAQLHGKEVKWSEWDPQTRVGWRGPMMEVSKLSSRPSLFWYNKRG